MRARIKVHPTAKILCTARLLALAGDPTRLRIFCFMFVRRRACVSEIAEGVGRSVAGVSHHLQLLRDNRLLVSRRMGTRVCYALAKSKFVRQLKPICLP